MVVNTKSSLQSVLTRFGMDTVAWAETISPFQNKLEFLSTTNRYRKLLRSISSSKNLSEFNGYVFEVLFAYDFECNGHPLKYEVKQSSSGTSPIDFCYDFDDKRKLYFELRALTQRAWITESMESQLKASNTWQIELGAQNEREEIIRLQSRMLEKVQGKGGNPARFHKPAKGVFNFIVANISEIQLQMFDKWDCRLTMHGDSAVPIFFQRGIFGLCQQLSPDSSDTETDLYKRFQHFRETIHGILFVRFGKNGFMGSLFIDRELEYFLVGNNNLLKKEHGELITARLSSFLKKWTVERKEPSPHN